jgi:alpha-amylase
MLTPESVAFCLLSFEGPDPYSLAGGLGVRVTHLAETLAEKGFETHLFFVGDPSATGRETRMDGRLTLHRWCQWISAHHPSGVYSAEEQKLNDFNDSAPPFIVDQIIRPVVESGRLAVVLAEEWHTAEAVIRLHHRLAKAGLRQNCVIFWNANNTMSFHRVNWHQLNGAAQLTTVSRYMKHLMWTMGLNPLVIPNGIPGDLLAPVDSDQVEALRQVLLPDDDALMLFKVGRFDPAKRWMSSVEAAARLKAEGYRVIFPMRGGIEPHGQEVLSRARQLGLYVTDVDGSPSSWEELLELLRPAAGADILNLRFFMSQEMMRPFFVAADAVLANSGHEPFGLVGLEAMAAGGLVFTGATGEEYALYGQCATVLDTDSLDEIVTQLLALKSKHDQAEIMRACARKRAVDFNWHKVIDILLDKVAFVMQATGVLSRHRDRMFSGGRRVSDVVIYTVVHQPRRLRLPAQPIQPGATPEMIAQALFDEPMNERYFRKVSARSYYPAVERFLALVDQGLKLSIGFSFSFIEQARRWDPALLKRFRELVQHDHVELVAVEPTHGFSFLWDISCFVQQMRYAADRLEETFGARPVIADTTELLMSDSVYHALDRAGFEAGFIDGRPWVMGRREPTTLFRHPQGQMNLLARHYQLSDDVGYRFSDRSWSGWPLMADTYARWISESPGDLAVLGWDFETFGEHHSFESGIFEFLAALPDEAKRAGLSFITPSEAIARYSQQSQELPLPAFASTWAGSGGMDFFLGNVAQQAVFRLMLQAYQKARLTGDPSLIELALWLSQSDNLHLIQWYGRSGSDAEVSAYFTPQEWWSLGPDGIITEIQQVYKNFVSALDSYITTVDRSPKLVDILPVGRLVTEPLPSLPKVTA